MSVLSRPSIIYTVFDFQLHFNWIVEVKTGVVVFKVRKVDK